MSNVPLWMLLFGLSPSPSPDPAISLPVSSGVLGQDTTERPPAHTHLSVLYVNLLVLYDARPCPRLWGCTCVDFSAKHFNKVCFL